MVSAASEQQDVLLRLSLQPHSLLLHSPGGDTSSLLRKLRGILNHSEEVQHDSQGHEQGTA